MSNQDDHLFGAHLPNELQEQIFEYVGEGSIVEGNYLETVPPEWRLVNRAWDRWISRFTFERFTFDGNPNYIHKLWWVLAQAVRYPHRAAMVRKLFLTTEDLYYRFNPRGSALRFVLIYTWKYGDRFIRQPRVPHLQNGMPTETDDEIWRYLQAGYLDAQGVLLSCFRENIKTWFFRAMYRRNARWVDSLMTELGWENGDDNLKLRAQRLLHSGKAWAGYQCPLVAMIIAVLPNLRELTLHDWSHAEDPWLTRTLGYAVGVNTELNAGQWADQPPLQKLHKLHVGPKRDRYARSSPCEISAETRPYWRLPALCDFAGYVVNCKPSFGQGQRGDKEACTATRIERLTLYGPVAHDLELPKWFRMCPRLKQFTLRLPGDYTPDGNETITPREDNGVHFINSLWNMLEPYKNQLQYLDIYQERLKPETFIKWYTDYLRTYRLQYMRVKPINGGMYVCPPLADFTELRMLSLNWFLLAGHDCYHANPFKMRSHLPPNVQSLGLYVEEILEHVEYVGGSVEPVAPIEQELARILDESTMTKYKRDPWVDELAWAPINNHELLRVTMDVDYPQHQAPDDPPRGMRRWAERKGIACEATQLEHLWYGGEMTYIGQSGGRSYGARDVGDGVAEDAIPRGLEVFGYVGALRDRRVVPMEYPELDPPRSPSDSSTGTHSTGGDIYHDEADNPNNAVNQAGMGAGNDDAMDTGE